MEDSLAGKSSSYNVWGGLPAVLASCDSFEADRAANATLQEMFDMLDHLTARCANRDRFAVIASALEECKLSAEAVSRMNSPLLDGLWRLVSGEDPDGVSELIVSPPVDQIVMLSRLLIPRWYKETVEFLGLLKHVNPFTLPTYRFYTEMRSTLVSSPLLCAAGSGRHDLVRMLLEHDFLLDFGLALIRAAEANDIASMELLLDSKRVQQRDLGSLITVSDSAAFVVASKSSRESLLLLLRANNRQTFCRALEGACSADDVDLLEWLWTMRESFDRPEISVECLELAGPRCLKALTSNPEFGCERLVGDTSFHLLLRDSDPIKLDILTSSPFFVRPVLDDFTIMIDRQLFVQAAEQIGLNLRAGQLKFSHLRTVIELSVFSPICRGRFFLKLLPIAFEFNDLTTVSFLLSCGTVAQTLETLPDLMRSDLVHLAAATGNLDIVDVVSACLLQDEAEQARFQNLRAEGLAALQIYDTSVVDLHCKFLRISAHCGQLSALKLSASRCRHGFGYSPVQSSIVIGMEALCIAIECNYLKLVEYLVHDHPQLLSMFHDIKPNRHSLRAVCSAARLGYLEMIQLIFNAERMQYWSAFVPRLLTEASFAGQLQVVEYLIGQLQATERGVQLYFDALMNGVLNSAVRGDLRVCCCFVDALLGSTNVDRMFLQRLDRSMRFVKSNVADGWHRLVRLLFESAAVSVDGSLQQWRRSSNHVARDEDALMAAARSGQLSLVRYFLDCGVSMYRVLGEETAVQAAARAGQDAVVQLLLSRGGKLPGRYTVTASPAITQRDAVAISNQTEIDGKTT